MSRCLPWGRLTGCHAKLVGVQGPVLTYNPMSPQSVYYRVISQATQTWQGRKFKNCLHTNATNALKSKDIGKHIPIEQIKTWVKIFFHAA